MTEAAETGTRVGGYRWTIAALLFGAMTVNYVDRQVIGLLAPMLTRELHWSESDYGVIVSYWSIAYGLGAMFMGRLLDRIGVRRGLTLAVSTWSLAAMAHALVSTVTGFSVVRALLGLGESANFPAAGKAVAEWFPKKERALAVGVYNAGPNVAVAVAAVLVPLITLALGWRWAFVATGMLDLLWLAWWLAVYRDPERHPRLTPEELAYIRSDPIESTAPMPWGPLWLRRQTLAFLVGKTLTDPVWFFYIFWLPKFLDAKFGVKLSGLPLPLIVIYTAASVGSIGGGWTSGALIKRGWTVNWARKLTMLLAALAIVPTILAPRAGSLWIAIAIVSVAATAHQWWSTNLQTLPSDMYPTQAVASVMGIGWFGGMLASFVFQRATGSILEVTHGNYVPVFAVLGFLYVTALAVIHLLVPRMEPARIPSA
ncbi:MAG: MFS transporter [Gemmatimonadales bacterium]|jgi:ACS family hexuronate transporter-like MFS transporter